MRAFSIAIVAGCFGAGAATAQTTWVSAPTAQEMASAFPEKARAAGVGGSVELTCNSGRDGALGGCAVLSEKPRGLGFGAAARLLLGTARVTGVPRNAPFTTMVTFPAELAKGGPYTVKTPHWTALPTVQELQTAVPKTEGGPNDVRVVLVCDVRAGGVLEGCVIDREEPPGQGFGPAILPLASRFRVDLMSGEGAPTVGAKVRVPVRFALKPVPQAPAK